MEKSKKTKKCDYCGKKISLRYRICPFCNGRLLDPLTQKIPKCPRCHVSLKTHLSPDQEEHELCSKCGGLWLDRMNFKQATRESNVYQKKHFKEEFRRSPNKDPIQYIPCVRCGKTMNRKNFARISGIIIDECRGHGVWLNPGELKKIQHFIFDGGLERAQDKKIENLQIDLKGLESKVGQVAFTQKLIHFWNVKRWFFSGIR